jgi:hypothetical protein
MRFTVGDLTAVTWAIACAFGGWRFHKPDIYYIAAQLTLIAVTVAYLCISIAWGASSFSNPRNPKRLFHDFVMFAAPVVFEVAVLVRHEATLRSGHYP